MTSDSYALVIPISLPTHNGQQRSGNEQLLEESFSQSAPSCIVSWGYQGSQEGESHTVNEHGIVVGCGDGSVFVLRPSGHEAAPNIPVSVPPPMSPTESISSPTSPRRYRGLGHPSSRSASPSSVKPSLSPFQVSRSRVVSSVSTESAEAPKNYVDFDDEQERLRGMLKGRGKHHRHASTSRTRNEKDTMPPVQVGGAAGGSSLRREDTRSYLSAALSPSSSTVSLSNPPSPTLIPAISPEPSSVTTWRMRCHVFPPHSRPNSAISALKVHESGRYFSCLHVSGGLSVHRMSDGCCVISTMIEAKPKAATGGKAQPTPSVLWVWRKLLVAASEESIILFACASPDELYPMNQFMDTTSGNSDSQSVLVAYELCFGPQADEASLLYLGQWYMNGPLNSIGLRAEHDHSITLFYANPNGHFVSRSIRVNDPPSSPLELPDSHSSTHLPLPNPFKALKALSTENVIETATQTVPERIEFGAEVDHGTLGLTEMVLGLRAHDVDDREARLCAWSEHELLIARWKQNVVERFPAFGAAGIQDARWISHESFSVLHAVRCLRLRISVLHADHLALYSILHAANGDKGSSVQQAKLLHTTPLSSYDTASIVPGGHVLSTRVKNGRRRIHFISVDPSEAPSESPKTRTLWKARSDAFASPSRSRISSLLPPELDAIVIGYADGRLCRSSLLSLAQNDSVTNQTSDFSLPGAILALDVVTNARTGERIVVGGADDGTIAMWSLDTLKLYARWTMFTTPLARTISLHDEKMGRLHGCILCVSQDGTIAVVAVDGFQFVYLVPASAAPLARICLSEDNLLLVYTDGRARLWDSKTREFWRSMSIEKAEELVQQGGWFEWDIVNTIEKTSALSSSHRASLDAASTLLVDIPALLRQLSGSPALADPGSAVLDRGAKLAHARVLLSMLLTCGISEGIDTICSEGLSIKAASATLGVASPDTLSVVPQPNAASVWTLSPEASADRALAILSLLHFLAQFEDLAQDASTVITFYAASIGQLVPDYQPPSLPRLAHHMLHTQTAEVRHAVRLLLDASVARLSDTETTELVETWQRYLPHIAADKERDSSRSAKALCICGFIAVDKYSLLPTSTLTDIAKSIAVYLHDETSPHRSLAIDLCSRGFQVWQQYVDAVEMLRALFTLATTTKKEAISVPNIGVQARVAVLHIAANNTPLFMTTLALDILHPRSVQHRKSVMQLVIFLIRKKPLVLYSNLPRLVEAIVKSLDPNSSASRDAVLDSATEILSHIVQTFPTVDFHMGSQRLAVGTSEGAVVMYDLKTATRLYVLEGHKKRTTACSFSPDGRRLVTLSLEESDVLVWKVGSSFTSFFLPGAPPRQGHSGSEPFKTLNFHIGDAAHMSIEATLVNVHFEWTADRSVKLKIKDTTLTFST